jgi:hypothetical protein
MSNISELKVVQNQPDEGLVEMVEKLLGRCRSGEITSMVVVADSAAATILFRTYPPKGDTNVRLIGALEIAKQRIMERLVDADV